MIIRHYGTKGMKWGVRKAGRGTKTFLTGDPSTSVLHPKGRTAAIAAGKKAVNKLTGGKLFKSMVFNKDANLITEKGRKGLAKKAKKATDKDIARAKKRREQSKKYMKQLKADVAKKKWSEADKKREIKNLKAAFKSDLNATPASMKRERKQMTKELIIATLLLIS